MNKAWTLFDTKYLYCDSVQPKKIFIVNSKENIYWKAVVREYSLKHLEHFPPWPKQLNPKRPQVCLPESDWPYTRNYPLAFDSKSLYICVWISYYLTNIKTSIPYIQEVHLIWWLYYANWTRLLGLYVAKYLNQCSAQ